MFRNDAIHNQFSTESADIPVDPSTDRLSQ